MNKNTQHAHCPCCGSICKIEGDNKEGSTRYFVPIDTTEQVEVLKREVLDLKMNQAMLEQAFIDMKNYIGQEEFDKMNKQIKDKIKQDFQKRKEF